MLKRLPKLHLQIRLGEFAFTAAWRWLGMSCIMFLNFFGGVSFVVVLAHPSDQLLLERTPEKRDDADLPFESNG